jgi:hypothetical protein
VACSDKNQPYRDTNGFRKIIIGISSSGKVVALHNGDGRVLWTIYLPQLAGTTEGDVVSCVLVSFLWVQCKAE